MSEEKTLTLEQRIEKLEVLVSDLRDYIITTHKHSIRSFNTIDENFEIIKEKVGEIDVKVDALAQTSDKGFSEVGVKIDGLQFEVKKIQRVSNYGEEYENLLRISK